MMAEGPSIQAAIGRLPSASLNLAAMGLTMSLSLLVESPVIMLLATAIALVRDGDSYVALRRFTLYLLGGCTILTALVAYTPLFGVIAGRLMGQPKAIVEAAQPAMRIMLLWSAAIGWRRFYQGILVGHHRTRFVSYGTVTRLIAALATAISLVHWGHLPGVQVGATALMFAVVTEAIATSCFALPIVAREVLPLAGRALGQREILRFHLPLAATTVLTLLAQPLTSAALARLASPRETLAAWPVIYMLLFVLRGWGFALQEITVAQARNPVALRPLYRFSWLVGIVTSAATALVAFTPLLQLYIGQVIHMPPHLWHYARVGVATGAVMPLVTALGSWARGMLVATGNTRMVYRGMWLNLTAHGTLLALSVALNLPPIPVAAGAFTLAALIELGFLASCVGPVRTSLSDAVDVEAVEELSAAEAAG